MTLFAVKGIKILMNISSNRQKKENIVSRLSDKIKRSKGLVFANYQGLTHKQLEDLKKTLRTVNAEIVVAKNTLLSRALQISNFKFQTPNFEGPTSVLFIYDDIILPLKNLAKSIKDFGLPAVKFGILDNQVLDAEHVLKLTTLPPREILLAQAVRGLKSPFYGLHRALNWNIQKLAMIVSVIQQKKSLNTKA